MDIRQKSTFFFLQRLLKSGQIFHRSEAIGKEEKRVNNTNIQTDIQKDRQTEGQKNKKEKHTFCLYTVLLETLV